MAEEEQVHEVFESIAAQYDRANSRISLGRHRAWKSALVRPAHEAAAEPGAIGAVLDVCCGTGDVTELLADDPNLKVSGLDFSDSMLEVARYRTAGRDNVTLIEGDAMDLPFADDSFDAALISYGLRNTPDYETVLREMCRVTRPGGVVACLDASVPENTAVLPFYTLYYKHVMPWLGGGASKHDEYDWLYQSTQEFLRKDELRELFERVGLTDVRVRSFMFGASALHTGRVPKDGGA